jgi:hypothetical protein
LDKVVSRAAISKAHKVVVYRSVLVLSTKELHMSAQYVTDGDRGKYIPPGPAARKLNGTIFAKQRTMLRGLSETMQNPKREFLKSISSAWPSADTIALLDGCIDQMPAQACRQLCLPNGTPYEAGAKKAGSILRAAMKWMASPAIGQVATSGTRPSVRACSGTVPTAVQRRRTERGSLLDRG